MASPICGILFKRTHRSTGIDQALAVKAFGRATMASSICSSLADPCIVHIYATDWYLLNE